MQLQPFTHGAAFSKERNALSQDEIDELSEASSSQQSAVEIIIGEGLF